jgi:glycosyltransferase involved in cell wall biosynthesis
MDGKGRQSLDVDQTPMHIGINAHLLSLAHTYRGAGINRYIYNLLLNLALADQEHQYTVFLGDRRFPPNPGLTLRTSWLPTTHPLVRIGWEQLVQPFVLWQQKIDLLHSLAFVTPLLSPCPSVVTIYDLSFILFPKGFKYSKRLYLTLLTGPSARSAKRIITISESTKRDTVRLLGVSPEKVDVVYCGVDKPFCPLPEREVASFRQKRGLPERIILFVGTIEPRKNVARLVEAYSRLRDGQVKLVIGGARGWLYEEVFARFEHKGFRIGPHKAFQIARDAARARVFLVSDMDPDFVQYLLLTPAASIDEALAIVLADLPADAQVGVMPWASSTIPGVMRDV